MKKLLTLALVLVLTLCLCACNQTPEPQEPAITDFMFPEGTSILNVDISGMTREAGWQTLCKAVAEHTLTLNVDGVEATLTSAEIGLNASRERYDAIADALEAGARELELGGLMSFNEGKLRALVNTYFNKPVTEAAIVFDEDTGAYTLVADANGQICNPNAVVAALHDGILQLESAQALTDISQILEPELKDEDAAIQQALQTVQKMSAVELTYSFTPEETTTTETIPAEAIRSFINLGVDNVTPTINYSALEAYVAELSDKHSAGNTTGPFIATGGGSVDLTVTYNGVLLDQESMIADIATCMEEGISGTRTAPFNASGIRDMPYGGTYIEVNLSAQQLWLYKYGECILTTPFVSGKVSAGWNTPTGVFSMVYKETDTYLEGDDYRTFVNYWMPFYGGYGLHDATWRGSFGGDIYLYGGSHGCVNLPLGAAATIYEYAPVGIRVIVYGGLGSVPAQPQSLSGTTSYDVADDIGTINLDIRPRYTGPSMTYASSNSAVASVNSSGVVTINGIGSAAITVSVPAYGGYSSAYTTVYITVHSPCDEGRHQLGTPTVTTPATCQPGKQTVSCTRDGCGYTGEETIDPVASHKFTTYTETTAPTCGADGVKTSTCDTCSTATDTKPIPATGNHVEGSGEVTTAPGCESAGVRSYICTGCPKVMRTEEIAATGHTTSWQTVTPATCTTPGEEQLKCACGYVESTRPINATGHSHVTVIEPAGCTTDGVQKSVCACGDVASSTPLPATGHSFSGGVCGSCGAADPNYVAPSDPTT